MELKEELTSYTAALNCIQKKDWYRARTVPENRIVSMLDAITDPRKMVGRVLAIYFYNKFALGNEYIYTRYDDYPLNRFLSAWLSGYITEFVRDQLATLRPEDIYPWVDDDEVLRRMQLRNSEQNHHESHLGFFESKKLSESLFLTKEQITNKIKELKHEFPERFEGINDSDIQNSLKEISIDYLDGCTDLVFNNEDTADITGNSTNVTEQPEYKALMSKVFEEVVDEWLKAHNLTHKDIVWFEYDPETNQMFVEFDANGVDFEDAELIQSHTDEQEESDEEGTSSLVKEELKTKNLEYYVVCDQTSNRILTTQGFKDLDTLSKRSNLRLFGTENIAWGYVKNKFGWHWPTIEDDCVVIKIDFTVSPQNRLGFFNESIKKISENFHERNKIKSKESTEEISEDDANLNETYSDEELDKMIGKTYNQQKIEGIYRRQKYNDKRLFARTKCINCGREKKVFLSNLVTNPEKYGSCVCSDTNVESRLDNIEDLFSGEKRLASNTSGYTGVSYIKTNKGELYDKWRAYIEVDGKRTYLGDFDSKSAAIRARKKAAQKGLKWYKEHKNEFMKNYRRKSRRHRRS